ncbi:MAG TPA: 7-cyano-7-deazaguanine synthase [Tepidisphaeraceae bacterium]|nr:7-cyano-7-deazaguanine synthase [Tepidisphaeraceae bacterium]
MAKDLAIILNNGSLNSAVATALAAQKYRLILLHAEVAASPASRPRAAYDAQVAHFKPYREHTLAMPYLSSVESSAAKPQPLADPRQPVAVGPVAVGLLPIMAVAARFAVHYQATAVYLGLRVGSGADEIAQATEYLQIWNELVQLPCGQPELNVEAPLLELEPWQVIDTGFQVSAPFEKTWSCQEEQGDACWACRGCRAREAAFQQAGKPDPLRVVKKL